MNEIERMIFAAVFAAEYHKEWTFRVQHVGVGGAMGSFGKSAYSIAEVADEAVKVYRRAMQSEDREYLLAVKENWPVK